MAVKKAAPIVRTDIHSPSRINPSDYEFVAFSIREMNYHYDAFLHVYLTERAALGRHMDRTGGKWASHQHGGSCMICGASAIYLATFYHKETNEYICCGSDCAEKMNMQDVERFRRLKDAIVAAQKARAGLKKAEGVLTTHNMSHVWDIYTLCTRPNKDTLEGVLRNAGLQGDEVSRMALRDLFAEQGLDPDAQPDPLQKEERTIIDIVGKLVKYGSISPKQRNFLCVLADRIKTRPVAVAKKAEVRAKWDAEKAVAKDVPVGRHTVTVRVLKTETKGYSDRPDDIRHVMTVKAEDGYVLWGTTPGAIVGDVRKGTVLRLTGTFQTSDRDPKFGFFSRPIASIISQPEQEG